MKSLTPLIGILLIILGIGLFAYQRITYNSEEKIAQIGNVQVTAETKKTVSIPPIVGGLAIIAGIVLVIAGRNK